MATSDTSLETLLFEIRDGVARITLNRPEAANTMNPQMGGDLVTAVERCEGNSEVRVVLFTASGTRFCAGGDLKSFAAFGDKITDAIAGLLETVHDAIARFVRLNAPVVTAVNGVAAGGGLAFITMADYVLAAQSASFTAAFTAAGLSPDSSSTYYLPRLIGLRRAQDMLLTNRLLSADEAADWGLISRVVADDALAVETDAVVAKLARGPTRAFGGVKKLLRQSWQNSLEDQVALESATFQENTKNRDSAEGIKAFIEKRRPEFTGD